jgi:hypothetical protein
MHAQWSGHMQTSKYLFVAAAIVALTAAMPAPAEARIYPYCAWYSDGSTNCGFPTMWSCQAAVSGVGGYCGVNPRAAQRRPAHNFPRQPYNPGWMGPPAYGNY